MAYSCGALDTLILTWLMQASKVFLYASVVQLAKW